MNGFQVVSLAIRALMLGQRTMNSRRRRGGMEFGTMLAFWLACAALGFALVNF